MKTIATSCLLALSIGVAARAQPWQQTSAPSTLWTGLACSADASVIAASVQGPAIFISRDSGATWTSNYIAVAAGYFITDVAMSGDGSHICAPNFNTPGGIICSSNFGNTWVTNATPVAFHALALSADGQQIAAVPIGSTAAMFTSTNFGVTWVSNHNANATWYAIASSADGSKLAAPIGFAPEVLTSTNYGVTWVTNSVSNASCLFVASSADGSRLVTGGNPQIPRSVYTSADGGATWNPTGLSNAAWNLAVSSADGSHLFVLSNSASIEISTNYGMSWNLDNSLMTNGIAHLACSSDGAVLIAATGSGSPTHGPVGGIYVKRSLQLPMLNIVASNALVLSWLVPSTNFSLQQTSNLFAGSWVAVTNTPILNTADLQNQITLPLPAVPTFYRLSTQ